MDKVVHFLTFTLFRFVLRENARSANEMRAKRQFFLYPKRPISKKNIWGPMLYCFSKYGNFRRQVPFGDMAKKILILPFQTMGNLDAEWILNLTKKVEIDAPYYAGVHEIVNSLLDGYQSKGGHELRGRNLNCDRYIFEIYV